MSFFAVLLTLENCVAEMVLCIFQALSVIALHSQVSWLRSQFPSLDIEVDGGVGPDTIHKCAEVRNTNTLMCLGA